MRHRLLAVFLAAPLVALAGPAAAVTIDWVAVGNPGNAADPSGSCYVPSCGSVAYSYYISKYEVTNTQYAEFLNAKAASDPLGLYNTGMGGSAQGGITRSGSPGSYTYAVKPGFANMPVNFVSFFDALRFSNWLNNGQGSGDTETGAYTLLGGTATPSNWITVARNPGAITFLTSENEWYKAAYYSPGGTYFGWPTGSNATPGCVAPAGDTGNSASCASSGPTNVGAYGLSDSPYGTFDQGGNVFEWVEHLPGFTNRVYRGGGWNLSVGYLHRSATFAGNPPDEGAALGFRVASFVPEPGTGLLVITGLLGLAVRRRRRG